MGDVGKIVTICLQESLDDIKNAGYSGSKVVPWDKFASAYMSMMRVDFGRPGIFYVYLNYMLIFKAKTN